MWLQRLGKVLTDVEHASGLSRRASQKWLPWQVVQWWMAIASAAQQVGLCIKTVSCAGTSSEINQGVVAVVCLPPCQCGAKPKSKAPRPDLKSVSSAGL